MAKKTHVIMILDGYGLNPDHNHNAVWLANTPVMDKLEAEYPFVQGYASGLAVGLPCHGGDIACILGCAAAVGVIII